MCGERLFNELLKQSADGITVSTHAALFDDHIAFFVKLAEHGMGVARCLQVCPQFQPVYLEGYHRPDYRDKDDAVYDTLADLLSEGRTSRLYRALVRDKKIASEAEGGTGYPGVKYPHIFYFFATPMPGHTPREVGDAIHTEIDRLKKEDISDEELRW